MSSGCAPWKPRTPPEAAAGRARSRHLGAQGDQSQKSGEPAGAARAGRVRLRTRPVRAARLRAARHCRAPPSSYELSLPAKDAPVIAAMKTLSAQYPRYGYRRIRIFLRRQGHQLGVHRTHRLWRQAGLQLPRSRPRRRIATGRPRPLPPSNANFVWAYDFVFDATAQGQQIKCLTVVDEFTHECLAIDVAGSIRSRARDRGALASDQRCTARRCSCARTTGRSSSATPSSSGSPRAASPRR